MAGNGPSEKEVKFMKEVGMKMMKLQVAVPGGAESQARGTQVPPSPSRVNFSGPPTYEDVYSAWQSLAPSSLPEMTKQQVQSLFRVIFTPSASDSKVAGRQGQPSSSSSAALEDAVDTACAVTYEQVENWTLDPALYKEFDAAGAAFRLLDPDDTGEVDLDRLMSLMQFLPGVDVLNEEDRRLLKAATDFDRDGKISKQDFLKIGKLPGPSDVVISNTQLD